MGETDTLEEPSGFSDLFCELVEGVLGNKDLGKRYKSSTEFRAFVDDVLSLYEGCKGAVLEKYGKKGLKRFKEDVSSKVNVVKRVIEY